MNTVREILKHKGRVMWSVSPDTITLDALRLLEEKDIGALLVIDAGRMVGIISERDFVRALAHEGQCHFDRPVSEYMTADVFTVNLDQPVEDCMKLMTGGHFRHLPVLDDAGHLVGVISIGDVVKQMISTQESVIHGLENYIEGNGHSL